MAIENKSLWEENLKTCSWLLTTKKKYSDLEEKKNTNTFLLKFFRLLDIVLEYSGCPAADKAY